MNGKLLMQFCYEYMYMYIVRPFVNRCHICILVRVENTGHFKTQWFNSTMTWLICLFRKGYGATPGPCSRADPVRGTRSARRYDGGSLHCCQYQRSGKSQESRHLQYKVPSLPKTRQDGGGHNNRGKVNNHVRQDSPLPLFITTVEDQSSE